MAGALEAPSTILQYRPCVDNCQNYAASKTHIEAPMISSSPNIRMLRLEINLTHDQNCDWDWGHMAKTDIDCEDGYRDHLNQLYYHYY